MTGQWQAVRLARAGVAATRAAAVEAALRYCALWMMGVSLRVTLLAVPPLIPAMHRELALSETAVSVLTSLPVLLLSAGAVAGSLLISRLGIRRAVLAGLLSVALFSGGRGMLHSKAVLFGCTLAMGLGIAVLQPLMPTVVKNWFPARVGIATALYSNGMLVGQVLAAGLTLPLVLPLARGSWAGALGLWSLPVWAAAGVASFALERGGGAANRLPWWPDWGDTRMWQISVLLGSSSSLYFAANAFLPDYLLHLGRAGSTAQALGAMSLSQIPAPVMVLALSGRLLGRRWPFIAAGVACFACVGAIVAGHGDRIVLAASVLGFCTALILTICLILPALLAPPEQVHRISAGMFAIAYALAALYPLLGGVLWDLTSIPEFAFAPALGAAVVVIVLAWVLDLRPA